VIRQCWQWWILTALLVLTLSAFGSGALRAAGGDILRPLEDGVPLRAAPASDAEVLRRLDHTQRLLLYEVRGDWLRVALFGAVAVEGWVERANVGREEKSPPAPAPKPETPKRPPPLPVFLLQVGGQPGLKFSGECRTVERSERIARRPFEGLAPKTYRFRAKAVSCRVEKEDFLGRLEVALSRSGRVIAGAETSAPLNTVRVRSDGPWGEAAGWRGNRGLIAPRQ
jgi:hypothetical protein